MRKRVLRVLVACVGLLIPFSTASAGTLQTADAIAGLRTAIHLEGWSPETPYEAKFVLPDGTVWSNRVRTSLKGDGTVVLPGEHTHTAGNYRLQLLQNSTVVSEETFEVLPDSVDSGLSDIRAARAFLAADGEDAVEIRVSLKDQYGNPLSGRPLELIASDPAARITQLSGETDRIGIQRFLVRTHADGLLILTAMDILSAQVLEDREELFAGSALPAMGGHLSFWRDDPRMSSPPTPSPWPVYPPPYNNSYNPYAASVLERAYAQERGFDVLDHFEVNIEPEDLHVNEVASLAVRAVDRFGRTVQDYTGIVRISALTDPDASLPGFAEGYGETTFTPRDLGEKRLPLVVSFTRSGRQILRIEDRLDPGNIISGEMEVLVGGESAIPEDRRIQITSHKPDDAVNKTSITLEGTGPPFVNLLVSGGIEDVYGETDQAGHFSIPLTLSPAQRDFTIRVRDDSGRYDSGSLHLILDQEDPKITVVRFAPEQPERGANVLLVAESEPHLEEITMTLDDQKYPLTENATEPGTYQVLFTAPASGSYQPEIAAIDGAGNTAKLRSELKVTTAALPQVQHVVAQARANAVELTWDPMTEEPVTAYRIYVGEEPENFLYTLDTDRATTTATVAGLKAGTMYSFAVTALQNDLESKEKSNVVSARVLGTKMTITEQEGSLLLEWTFPEGTPLSSFLLEYGVEPNQFTEKRILNGALRTTTIRDLLSGVTYYLRLTPMSTTGDLLAELAATGQGTPAIGVGFHPSAPTEPGLVAIPDIPETLELPPSTTLHEATPATPSSGLPPVAVWGGLSLAGVALAIHWHRRRTMKMTMEFLRLMEERYHR